MPIFDDLRRSLFGDAHDLTVYRCRSCRGSFSARADLDPSEVECSFCGSSDVRPQN